MTSKGNSCDYNFLVLKLKCMLIVEFKEAKENENWGRIIEEMAWETTYILS